MNNDALENPSSEKPTIPAPSEQIYSQEEVTLPSSYQQQLLASNYTQPEMPPPPPGWPTAFPPYPATGQPFYPPSPPIAPKKHTARNITLIVIALCLLIAGGIGFLIVHNSTATTTNTADKYPTYLPGQGQLALSDPLKQQQNWYNNGSHCVFVNNAFHVSSVGNNDNYHCFALPNNTALEHATNSAFEVQMTIIKGDCGGLDLRISPSAFPNHHKFYFINICQDGGFNIFKYNVSKLGSEIIKQFDYSTAIKRGINQTNTIDAFAKASTLSVYVNGQQIASLQDTSLSEGTFGLAANTGRGNVTEVAYREAKIWTLS